MIGQEVHLGTLACTAVEPLKVLSIATYHYSFASNSTKSKKKITKLEFFFWKILRSKWHRAKVPPKRFHLTGNTMRFHPEIRMLQHAEKVVFDSPGLVYFAIGLVNSLLNLLDRQVKSLWEFNYYRRTVNNIGHQLFFKLVEMTFELVRAS